LAVDDGSGCREAECHEERDEAEHCSESLAVLSCLADVVASLL
jgi:hypothetical protein